MHAKGLSQYLEQSLVINKDQIQLLLGKNNLQEINSCQALDSLSIGDKIFEKMLLTLFFLGSGKAGYSASLHKIKYFFFILVQLEPNFLPKSPTTVKF